jgi:CRP-like cAMP-binding protein
MTQLSFKDLRQYCYFSCLSDGALESVSKKFELVKLPAKTLIIEEGAPADAFYMVCKGEVGVTKKNQWGQTATISVAGHGESFGEMALLTCSPRFCSVTANTDVTLLKLSKSDFEEIVREDSEFAGLMVDRHQRYYRYNDIKTSEPFALLPPEKMSALLDKLKIINCAPGEEIITQGERGDEYYIMKSGKVAVMKKMLTDEAEHVATLEEGQGFGEEALITDSPRNATVKAIDETAVWTLSKADFDSIVKSSFLEEVYPEDIDPETDGHISYLDVRMKMEYEEEYIPGAVNIPLDELRMRYAELDRSKEYYIYCLMGARSATAAFLMSSQGFRARSIKGGFTAWTGSVEQGNDGIHTPFKPT